ncbi:MAG: hypothetical protein IT385_09610 [Deltaproteobacteria bacterium]|nr:hypothetical protein [Deltaproteobacteria bacterium]
MSLAACGDSGGSGGDTTTTTDTSGGDGSGDVEVTLPTGCYLPAAPTTTMDCALMCEKVDACGIAEDDCLASCLEYTYLLAPEAGPRVEECFVESPCNSHPAAIGALGCIATLKDDDAYTPPAGNLAACDAIQAKAESCNLATSVKDQITFLCDVAEHGLSADIMGRAGACATEACDTFVACLDDSSCAWDGLLEDDDIPDERDACANDRDRNAIGTEPIVSEALTCIDGCADGTFACARDCLVDGSQLTGPCSTCFTVLGRCMRGACDAACAADPSAAGCYACLEAEGCDDAFAVCAGIPVPGSPDDQLDCDADDRAELAREDMIENLTKCVDQCSDGATCLGECTEALITVSPRCTDCAGELAVCAAGACKDACDTLGDELGCYRCVAATSCLSDFEACSDFPIGAPEGGACLGPGDVTAAEDGGAWAATAACVGSCAGGAEGCMGECVARDAGTSETCDPCYTTFGTCVSAACATPCTADAESPECAACIAGTTCTAGFESCAGLPPYDPPEPGTATCDATLDCALACTGAGAAACVEACIQGAVPAGIPLARRVTTCLRETCAGKDASCLALECLADYQQCTGVTPEHTCVELGECLGACATPECQGSCFVRAETAGDAERLVAMNACIARFCEAGDQGCLDLVLTDLALCAGPLALCQDPSAELPAPGCREIASCVSVCPTVECADACVPPDLASGITAQLSAYFTCLQTECPEGGRACVIDHCWGELNVCYGEPGFGLTCAQVDACKAECTSYSCSEACLGTAADEATALAYQSLTDCIIDACLGVDGTIDPQCQLAVINEGGGCHSLAVACFPQ